MPTVSLDVTSSNDRSAVIASRKFEGGYLFSLTAQILVGTSDHARTHILAGITDAEDSTDKISTILLDDYVSDGHRPAWTGKVPVQTGQFLIIVTRSSDAPVLRVSGSVLKYDP